MILIASFWLAACAPREAATDDVEANDSDPGGGGDGGGGGGGGGGTTGCEAVCFDWNAPVAPVAPRPPGTTSPRTPWEVDRCNDFGVDAGNCPEHMPCGAKTLQESPTGWLVNAPFCEGVGAPYVLVADLTPPPEDEKVDVVLNLTAGGLPWGVGPGYAGHASLRGREGGLSLNVALPVDGQPLLLRLVPDTYDVYFSASEEGFNDALWPRVGDSGVLQVVKEGQDSVEVGAVPVQLRVFLDDVRQSAMNGGLVLSFRSEDRGQRLAFTDQQVPDRVWMYPGQWTVDVSVYPSDTAWPQGTVTLPGAVEVAEAGDRVDVRVRSVAVDGAVTVDGEVPDRWSGARVVVQGSLSAASFEVEEGSWAGRVFDEDVDVALGLNGSGRDYPNGTLQAMQGQRPRRGMDIAATSVAADGVVTMNGVVPPSSERLRRVHFDYPDGSSASIEAYTATHRFTGRTWRGRADVSYSGDGVTTPDCVLPLAVGRQVGTGMSFDFAARQLDLLVRVDGALGSLSSAYNATYTFTEIDAVGGDPVLTSTWGCQTSGTQGTTTHVRTWLPPAVWRVALRNSGETMPRGAVFLGDFNVRNDLTREVDLETVDIAVRLTVDGQPLAASTGSDRGNVLIDGHYGTVPASGPSKTDLVVWPGWGHVTWSCYAASGCRIDGFPEVTSLTLWSYLAWNP